MASSPPKVTDASVTITYTVDGVASGAYWGYCTLADVKYEFTNLTSYQTLTNSVIGQEITGAAFELHELLDHLYQMPYAGTNSGILVQMRDMNDKLAVARLIDRYFSGNEPDLSQHAAARRHWVSGLIEDLRTGLVQWAAPFGDAMPQAMQPIYNLALGATGFPNAFVNDPNQQSAVFGMGRSIYRRGSAI